MSTFDLPELPGLATTADPRSLALQTGVLDLRQCIVGAGIDELVQHHRRALALVRERGVPIRPADPEAFPSLMRHSAEETRARFINELPTSIFRMLWRAWTNRSPEHRPIAEQPAAEGVLRRLQALVEGSGSLPGPPHPF